MPCDSMQFQSLLFCGTHVKYHEARQLIKHDHLQIDPKLGHGKYVIIWIPRMCIACNEMLDKSWFIGNEPTRKPIYQTAEEFTYWPVLYSFNKWIMIQLNNRTTINEDFDAGHKVVLYGIRDCQNKTLRQAVIRRQ